MTSNRKIQWGAAVVIANGLLGLSAVAPNIASANPCSTIILCSATCPGSNDTARCQAAAPAGCTVTSAVCFPAQCNGLPITLSCQYQ
jgi:hypothetical protein